MRPLLSSLNRWGMLFSLIFPGVGAAQAAPAGALDGNGGFAVLFDARERLPRPDLSNIVRLRILTTSDFPPFNFADQTGRLTGFHIDLAREICAELQIEAKCQIQALDRKCVGSGKSVSVSLKLGGR